MFRRFRPLLLAGAALLAVVALVTGCAGTSTTGVPKVESGAIVIDVRMPAEFVDGHLDGARNIDLQSAEFVSRIAGLDPGAAYVVYCRSGNRSAQAVTLMEAAGFTDVTDAGGMDEAATLTGLPVVNG